MSSPSEGSSVARAVANVLRLFFGNDRVGCGAEEKNSPYRVLSYREDFDYLWGIDRHSPFFMSGVQRVDDGHLVIVWNDIPQGMENSPVDTKKYLTPLDWGVALSLSIEDAVQQGKREQYPDLHIHILDLASKRAKRADSVRFFEQFPKRTVRALRWIRLYHPMEKGENAWSFSSMLAHAVSGSAMPSMRACFASDAQPDLKTIRRYWASIFTKPSTPGDRHAISNLMGPLVLTKDKDANRHVLALRQLMRTVGLMPDTDKETAHLTSQTSWIDWDADSWKDRMNRLTDKLGCEWIHLVLLDDMVFEHGWGKVLCRAIDARYEPPKGVDLSERPMIGVNPNHPITVEASLPGQWLIDQLDSTDRRFNLRFADEEVATSGARAEILFLDLRLFSGSDLEGEKEFIRILLERARRFEVDAQVNPFVKQGNGSRVDSELPWPGFDTEELDEIEAWLSGGRREEPPYHKALTLLPRLIALTDLSLPIVLFSSTGRREITEALKPYRNIITSFDKPRFFDALSSDVASKTAEKFREAFAQALDLAAARVLCASLPEPSKYHKAKSTGLVQANRAEGHWKVELMLDESGVSEDELSVGGLVALFPPGTSLEDIEERLGSEYNRSRDLKHQLREDVERVASIIREVARDKDIDVAAIAIAGSTDDSVYSDLERSDELHDERVADNLHRELVRCVIEASIYHWARHRTPSGTRVSFSVRAATRHMPLLEEEGAAQSYRKALFERWGTSTVPVGKGAPVWKAEKEMSKAVHRLPEDLQGQARHILNLLQDMKSKFHGDLAPDRMVRFFGFDAARPLVEEVMREYRGGRYEPTADLVRAFRLNSSKEHIPIMHFFADAVVSSRRDSPNVAELWNNGFVGSYGSDLQVLLRAHRLILCSFPAQGIAEGGFAALRNASKNQQIPSLEARLSRDLQLASQEVAGEDFITLASLLGEPLSSNESDRRGRVSRKTSSFILVEKGEEQAITIRIGKEQCTGFDEIEVGDIVSIRKRRSRIPGRRPVHEVKKWPLERN